MPKYIPVSVHYDPHEHPGAIYHCKGCTYNVCKGGLYPDDTIVCALASLEGLSDPIMPKIRSYPCGRVNPWPMYYGHPCASAYMVG